jgi:hypothetical protein
MQRNFSEEDLFAEVDALGPDDAGDEDDALLDDIDDFDDDIAQEDAAEEFEQELHRREAAQKKEKKFASSPVGQISLFYGKVIKSYHFHLFVFDWRLQSSLLLLKNYFLIFHPYSTRQSQEHSSN